MSDRDFRNGVATISMFVLLPLGVIALDVMRSVVDDTMNILKLFERRIELNYHDAVQIFCFIGPLFNIRWLYEAVPPLIKTPG